MSRLLLSALLGLLMGFASARGFSIAYAACEAGCQESVVWVNKDSKCLFHDDGFDQANDGEVAGDIGTLTDMEGQVGWTKCPSPCCFANCPDPSLTVFFQAAGNMTQCCEEPLATGTVTKRFCEEP